MNKQLTQNKQIFTIDLKIGKKILKLIVLQEDQLNDLGVKLFKLANIKQKEQCKYLSKLQQALKKIYEQGDISQNIKNKIYKLLNHIKIKIQDVDISKSTQTPFRILQNSINMAKQQRFSPEKRKFNYDIDLLQPKITFQKIQREMIKIQKSANITNNYGHNFIKQKRNYQYQYHVEPTTNFLFQQNHHKILPQNPIKPYKNTTMTLQTFNRPNEQGQTTKDSLTRKYEQLDKRCDDYIIKNIKAEKSYKSIPSYNHHHHQINQNNTNNNANKLNNDERNNRVYTSLKNQYKNYIQQQQKCKIKNKDDYESNIDHKFGQLDLTNTLSQRNIHKHNSKTYQITNNNSHHTIAYNNYQPIPLSTNNQNLPSSIYNSKPSNYNLPANTSTENIKSPRNNPIYASPYNMLQDANIALNNYQYIPKNEQQNIITDYDFKRKGGRKFNYLDDEK